MVDAISAPPISPAETLAYFATTTRNLLAAEERAGVRHHALLSIVGIHRIEGGTAHYSGKREQERLIEEGGVPWTIVPATQFHHFAALAASWTERDGVATIAPLLVQPIAPDDIAQVLAEIATGEPQGRYVDVADPETQDLVDIARRTNDVLGGKLKLVPTWSGPLMSRWPAMSCCTARTPASPRQRSTTGWQPAPDSRPHKACSAAAAVSMW